MKKEKVFAFIDSQNLNLGTSKNLYNKKRKLIYTGWKLDFQKFRIYLKDKFRVSKAFLFIGHIPQNVQMYNSLRSYGYEIIFKPTTKDMQGKPKGNIAGTFSFTVFANHTYGAFRNNIPGHLLSASGTITTIHFAPSFKSLLDPSNHS